MFVLNQKKLVIVRAHLDGAGIMIKKRRHACHLHIVAVVETITTSLVETGV